MRAISIPPARSSTVARKELNRRDALATTARVEAAEVQETAEALSSSPVGSPAARFDSVPSQTLSLLTVDDGKLLARAEALLKQSDISGARAMLDRAVEGGSARAAFMLAETYDARMLSAWRTSGIREDVAKARHFYERARAAGIELATERLQSLK